MKAKGEGLGEGALIVILTTFGNEEDAKKVARTLVEEGLVACAWVTQKVRSFYVWKGKLEEDEEVVVVLKAPKKTFEKAVKRLRELHPYEVPEIIAFEANYVLPEYLKWAEEVCG
ncbi:TPA: divalent cation tolerance protein CutA [Desulfurococcaceae archaeon]|nr:divalent cation tolerance protein CutA [Desulfurococcaceae archaeon]